jgi:hypothetical protein
MTVILKPAAPEMKVEREESHIGFGNIGSIRSSTMVGQFITADAYTTKVKSQL